MEGCVIVLFVVITMIRTMRKKKKEKKMEKKDKKKNNNNNSNYRNKNPGSGEVIANKMRIETCQTSIVYYFSFCKIMMNKEVVKSIPNNDNVNFW